MGNPHAASTAPRAINRSFMLSFVALLIALAIVFLANFRLFITDGPSMEPTYSPGTWVMARRIYSTPSVGDTVFLRYKGIYCLKRVAFIPGDDVSTAGYEGYWGSNIVPEGYVYVLGDNPDHSADSRDPQFGLVAIDNIWGKPLVHRPKG